MKTLPVTCPDPLCGEEFDVEIDEADLLPDADDGDLIDCPGSCCESYAWEYDATTNTLTLLGDEDDDEDEDDALALVEDEDDDEEEESK